MLVDCKTVRIFAYSSTREQSNKRSGTRLKTESETGDGTLYGFTDFFTDFEKKTDCFAVYRVRCKTIETSILIVNEDSLPGPLIIGTFEKRAPGP